MGWGEVRPTHLVAESLKADLGVPQEVRDDGVAAPSSQLLLKHEGQVPVIQGHEGCDAFFQTAVNHLVVIGHAFRVDLPCPRVRDDACPCDGQAVGGNLKNVKQ